MKEEYRTIENYPNYEVSNLGNVRNKKTNLLLKAAKDKQGYLRVSLHKDNKGYTLKVHRLVALAFIPNTNNKPEVNHIDEDKTNNIVTNLNWMTRKENINWGTRNKRSAIKGAKTRCKPIILYSLDGEFIKEWQSVTEVSNILGYNLGNLSSCCRGERKTAYKFIWRFKDESK